MQSGQFFQDLGIGAGPGLGGLLDHRQSEFRKKNALQLLGRSDVEPVTGQGVNFPLQFFQTPAVLLA